MSSYLRFADWGDWKCESVLTPRTYTDCLLESGAYPVLLPAARTNNIAEIVERLGGLVLIGGEDVCGLQYGRDEDPAEHESLGHQPERDAFEIAAARAAWNGGVPILAICRGMQVLNVALGGTLIPDLPTHGASGEHRVHPGEFNNHCVSFRSESILASLYGPNADVPSHHHQAVETFGSGLDAVGWAPDGVVEAIESAGDRFAVGVQWHPEEGEDMELFQAFVSACREPR